MRNFIDKHPGVSLGLLFLMLALGESLVELIIWIL